MKNCIQLLCIFLMLVSIPLQARADVIYEPWDSFYEEHREECVYHARSYTANGPNGNVTAYESPESDWKEKVLENGTTLWISYTYVDGRGIEWGCFESWEDDIIGWVPMNYLELIYDGISFEEEYGSSFENVSGALDGAELTGQTVYFWKYPGSSDCYEIKLESEYRPEYHTLYTDADGTVWGRCDYYMGIRDCWIDLNDPTLDHTKAVAPLPDETEGPAIPDTMPENSEPVEEIVPQSNSGIKLIVIAAVAAIVVITAVLLYLLKKKKA